MEERSCTRLEAGWHNINPSCTYSEWEAKRRGDWQRIISQKLPELGKSIAVDGGLFTYLQSKAVFDRRTIETFKQEAGTYAQVSSLLHALGRQSFTGFIAFCECLVETGQTAVIVEFLTPELREQRHHHHQQQQQQQQSALNVDVRQHSSGEESASLQMLGVVDLRPDNESDEELHHPAASSVAVTPAAVVNFDWKSLIRENFMQLTQHVDPDSGLLNELQSRDVISHVAADVIKSKKGRVNRVGAILDHVTQFRPDADFVKLRDALTATNQQHVVDLYLTKDAAVQPAPPSDDGNLSAGVVSTEYNQAGKVVDAWRSVLVQRRSTIIDVLYSSDDFVSRLVSYGVMNFATGELCREESDVVARSEFILDHMQRRASLDMAYFCQGLDDTNQHHVVAELFLQKTTNDP